MNNHTKVFLCCLITALLLYIGLDPKFQIKISTHIYNFQQVLGPTPNRPPTPAPYTAPDPAPTPAPEPTAGSPIALAVTNGRLGNQADIAASLTANVSLNFCSLTLGLPASRMQQGCQDLDLREPHRAQLEVRLFCSARSGPFHNTQLSLHQRLLSATRCRALTNKTKQCTALYKKMQKFIQFNIFFMCFIIRKKMLRS